MHPFSRPRHSRRLFGLVRLFRPFRLWRLAPAAALGLAAAACLPGDERPPPGVVEVRLEGVGGLEARAPFEARDGWRIVFDRVIVATAGVEEQVDEGDPSDDEPPPCTFYYHTAMRAIYDLTVPGPRLLGHFGGLGDCDFDVAWGRVGLSPDVLGPGVSAEDLEGILEEVAAVDRGAPALYVAGALTRFGGERKTFRWFFSPRFVFGACGRGRGALTVRRRLDAGASLELVVTAHPELLFADNTDLAVAALLGGALAEADDEGDGDGEIERSELERLALGPLGRIGQYEMPRGAPPLLDPLGNPRDASLLDFLSLQVGHVFQFDGRDPCTGQTEAE